MSANSLRRSAFDEVTRDRERRTGEADQRCVGRLEFLHHEVDRLRDVRDVDVGEVAESFQVGGAREGFGDHRSTSRHDLDAETDGVVRHDDVAEEDRGVDAVATDGLHRDLTGDRGVGDGVEDRAGSAQFSVLGERPSGLAHEPHRYVRDALAATGPKENWLAHFTPSYPPQST